MFKKDNWTLGMAIGIVLPLIIYAIAILILSQWGEVKSFVYTPNPKTPALIGVVANILAFRYFMVNLKYDKTGRGILFVTFALVIAMFVFI